MADLACHMSALKKGECPHPPHRHNEEEILLVLDGQVEIPLPDLASSAVPGEGDSAGTPSIRLNAGEFVYYPSYFAHTLTAVSDDPARYLMFKWQDEESVARRSPGLKGAPGPDAGSETEDESRPNQPLRHLRHDVNAEFRALEEEEGFRYRQLFQGPTEFLERLGGHLSTLTPGAGYPPHRDPYDVGIVVLKGEVETLGRSVPAGNLIYYAAGEPHGMRNSGGETAEYLVFEFQGRAPLWAKLTDPSRWKGKLRSLVGRLPPEGKASGS
jgi:quercetin dioxygenase-like cupin family protein